MYICGRESPRGKENFPEDRPSIAICFFRCSERGYLLFFEEFQVASHFRELERLALISTTSVIGPMVVAVSIEIGGRRRSEWSDWCWNWLCSVGLETVLVFPL